MASNGNRRKYGKTLLWLAIGAWLVFAFLFWFVNSKPSSRLIRANESISAEDFARNGQGYLAFADCFLNGGNREKCGKNAPSDEILFFSKATDRTYCGWGSGSLLSEKPEIHAYLRKGVGASFRKTYVYYPQSSPFATIPKGEQISGSGGVLLTVLNEKWAVCQEPVIPR